MENSGKIHLSCSIPSFRCQVVKGTSQSVFMFQLQNERMHSFCNNNYKKHTGGVGSDAHIDSQRQGHFYFFAN